MASERITMYRTNEAKTEVIEQLPKTVTSQVYDFENKMFLDQSLKVMHENKHHIEIVDELPSDYTGRGILLKKDGSVGESPEKPLILELFQDVNSKITQVQDGLAEAFLLGNSRKEDVVDKLLLVDNSLPINHNSTWSEILNVITMISTGKKWASGTKQLISQKLTFDDLEFIPSTVIYYTTSAQSGVLACGGTYVKDSGMYIDGTITNHVGYYKKSGYNLNSSYNYPVDVSQGYLSITVQIAETPIFNYIAIE